MPESTGDTAVVNPHGIKTHLANDLIKFFINCKPTFSKVPSILPRKLPIL